MKKNLIVILLLFLSIKNVSASSIVMDMDNKRTLYENNIYNQKLIASTTKIMTALLAIESNRLEEVITVSDEVLKMYGSNIYITKDEKILLLDLVYGLMLRSGNDAAVVIAKNIGKTEDNFVKMMNNKAKEIGMVDTYFANPHGLDDETKNYSTVYDLCLLYSYAYEYPIFKKIVISQEYKTNSSFNNYYWINRNEILSKYEYATGGKTGYTPLAGRILVSSAEKNNIKLCIATIDNNSYLYDFHIAKYNYIFDNYKKYLILDKDNITINGISENIYLKKDFYYVLNDSEYKNINIKFDINKQNNVLGNVYVYLKDEVIEKQTIYLKENKKTIFSKLKEFFAKILSF